MNEPLAPVSEPLAPPSSVRLHDQESRRRKAQKILAILRAAMGPGRYDLRCLDVGCAAGHITYQLATEYAHVVGLDPDEAALSLAPQRENLRFALGDALTLPFGDGAFDVVVCAQVYEHVAAPEKLIAEIWRVMKDRGVCFFSGPNKLAVVEAHYGLPFLHWLPAAAAARYLRLTGRGHSYQEQPLTHWQLRRLLEPLFAVQDYTVEMLSAPARYHCADEVPLGRVLCRLPRFVWRGLYALLPNYNLVLTKHEFPAGKA